MNASDLSLDRDNAIASEAADFPPVPADLFPLPLASFEHYMVADDSPRQPMIECAQAYFRGQIDLAKLDYAIHQALRRNPLLASRLVPRMKSWDWVYDPTWKPVIRSFTQEPPIVDGRLVPMDLAKEPGLRVWYDQQQQNGRLYFEFHHACADGIGVRRFLIDVLVIYARDCLAESASGKSNLRLDRVDHQRLLARGSMQPVEQNTSAKSITFLDRMKNYHYFFFQPPLPLKHISNFPARETSNSCELIKVIRLGVEESGGIVDRANKLDVTLNDLGIALLFHTCRLWQQMQDGKKANQRMRLVVPVDLRVKEDLRLSAANRVSFSFIGRTHQQCDPWSELLGSVQSEMNYKKETQEHADFLYALQSGLKHPMILRWMLRNCRNMATAIYTYLGDLNRRVNRNFAEEDGLTRVGNLLLEDVMAAPCIRTNTNIALTLCIANGKICMAASWNREELTASDTERFLNLFADAWRQWGLHGKPLNSTSS